MTHTPFIKLSLVALLSTACSASGAGVGSGTSGGGGESASGGSGNTSGSGSVSGSDAAIDVGVIEGGGSCQNCTPCEQAAFNKESVGCEYYAVYMDALSSGFGGCFVAFVANTQAAPVHISAEYAGKSLDVGAIARIPKGSGPSLTYQSFDANVGLGPGEVAILFLGHDGDFTPTGSPLSDPVQCPVPPAISDGSAQFHNTNWGNAFHITTDLPVVAYQMLPYGGGKASVTGATLLIPTSAWGTNYIAVEAYKQTKLLYLPPSMNIVAMQDETLVTMLPSSEIKGYGNIVPPGQANTPYEVTLAKGQMLQLTESAEYTGSPIVSSKPIGLFGGHVCMNVPYDSDWCDHAEQQIPAIASLGNEYAAVGYRDRIPGVPEKRLWRLVGVVDGTQLSYDPPGTPGPSALELGEVVELVSDDPFVVKSQDGAHPFLLFGYMSGALNLDAHVGDPEILRVIPGAQYLKRYSFFTDPTYPETSLVVVRRKGKSGFLPVTLACRGELDGWQSLGQSYEYARVDLVTGNFQPVLGCDNGGQEMTSEEQFGVYVWGWGSAQTSGGDCWGPGIHTCDVSYAYPAGENLVPINDVFVPPVPK